MTREERKVIFASSLGTVFEWYDFYLYGSLAAIIGKQFFAALDPTAAFIASLMAFAAGFLVRPFGAIFFGRLGDIVGRKYTFLVTILIMGLSTFVVGVLPSYASIGIAAPIILVALRLLQGLALGGEYGGAATYVAEHAPHGRRGAYTSWIQTTATLGLFLSLIVIIAVKAILGDAAFNDWGWRIPFLMSIFLLAISVWIRLSLNESPAFKRMKEEGKTSKAPLSESFGQWKNAKIVLLALLGLTAGQGVVWYTGQFYALFFLTAQLKVEPTTGAADDRRFAAAGHAVLHHLRHALGQDRPQAHHHGRLPAGGTDLLPAVRRPDQGRQSGAGAGAAEEQGDRAAPTRRSARSRAARSPARSTSRRRATSPSASWRRARSATTTSTRRPAARPPSRWATRRSRRRQRRS
jgi:MFS family permease